MENRKGILILLAALFSGGLAGCANAPWDPAKLSKEQLHELNGLMLVSDTNVMGPGYTGRIRQIVYDPDKNPGGVKIAPDGSIDVASSSAPPPVSKVIALCSEGKAFILVGAKLLATPSEDSTCKP